MNLNILNTLIASSFGLFGVFLSIYYSIKLNKSTIIFQQELEKKRNHQIVWQEQFQTLRQLVAWRHKLESDQFQSALNSIPASFYDSPSVLLQLKNFNHSIESDDSSDTKTRSLINLFISIYKYLDIDVNIDEELIRRTFQVPNND